MIGIEPPGISAVGRQNQVVCPKQKGGQAATGQRYLGVVMARDVGAVACDMAQG